MTTSVEAGTQHPADDRVDAPSGGRAATVTTGLLRSPLVLGVLGVLGAVFLDELLPSIGVVDREFFPPFGSIMSALGAMVSTHAFWAALGATVRGAVIGFVIAAVAGLVVGMVVGGVPVLRAATASTVEFFRPIPSVALVPAVVLILGTGPDSTLALVVYAAFWQVFIQVTHGMQDVDPVARDTARSYRLSLWRRVRTVMWPTTLPYLLTGLRLAAAIALILEITGELVIGSPGLGRQILVAQSSGAAAKIYALVVVTGLIGVLVNLVARTAERRILRWHPSIRLEGR